MDRFNCGNAETGFEFIPSMALNKNKGYLMSPFDHARWDLDDEQKFAKHGRKGEKPLQFFREQAKEAAAKHQEEVQQQQMQMQVPMQMQAAQQMQMQPQQQVQMQMPMPQQQQQPVRPQSAIVAPTTPPHQAMHFHDESDYTKRTWKTAPDQYVWIPGEAQYVPMGPLDPRSSNVYPVRDRNVYMPLS